LVYHTKGGTRAEDAQEQGAEKIFGSKRQELKQDWRKFDSKELNDLHLLPTNSVMQICHSECSIAATSKEIHIDRRFITVHTTAINLYIS